MSRIAGYLSGLFRMAATVGAAGLIAIAVMITVDVGMRWATGRAIGGVFEIACVLLVVVTFLPLGLVVHEERQLRVDIVPGLLKGKALAAVDLFDCAIGILVFGLLLKVASEEFGKAYFGRFLLRGLIEIPTWIPTLMIWIGALSAVVALAFKAVETVEVLRGKIGKRQVQHDITGGAM
jgi:TRAP-type C4-dicarboxylate transport system permease small subunit